ncbi:MAG: ester cyclase [Saprospiraceae bacterium]
MKYIFSFAFLFSIILIGNSQTQSDKNKEFIKRYYTAISGKIKTPELLSQFIRDTSLSNQVIIFDSSFPGYTMTANEMISEGNKLVVKAIMRGKHEGIFVNIPPTHKNVETPMVLFYQIENNKIISLWAMSNLIDVLNKN